MMAPRWIPRVLTIMGMYLFAYPAFAYALESVTGGYLLALILVFSISWLAILIHELGHSYAAKIAGWRVHLIVVLGLGYSPRQRRFMKVAPTSRSNDIGGWVLATPGPDKDWGRGQIAFTAGGPAANIAFGISAILIAFAFGDDLRGFFGSLLGIGEIFLIVGFANLIPTGGVVFHKSDGAQLIDAIRGIRPTPYQQQAARLIGLVYDGVPAREWAISDLDLLIRSDEGEDDSLQLILLSYAFAMADLKAVRSILEPLYQKAPNGLPEYRCTYAFVLAMTGADMTVAAEILDTLPKSVDRKSFDYFRARAVVDYMLLKPEEAMRAVTSALQAAARNGQDPDDDDKAVFEAIEKGHALPDLPPRVFVHYRADAPAKSSIAQLSSAPPGAPFDPAAASALKPVP